MNSCGQPTSGGDRERGYEKRRKLENEAQNILGCTAVFLIECRPTFQRYVLPPSSGRWNRT